MHLRIDHVVIAVGDLDAAAAGYGALGFTVTAGGEHPRGSRNALICFEDGSYLEIIAFARPVPEFRWWQVLQRAGSGLVDYALLPEDLDMATSRARRHGIAIDGAIDGERRQPDGSRIAWRSARPPQSDIPFFCVDVTDPVLRVPDGAARRHANGVRGISAIRVAVDDLALSTARYEALLGMEATMTRMPSFTIGAQTLSLAARDADDALAEHLDRRGEGPFAIVFDGPERGDLDRGLAQGVRLEMALKP